MKTTKTSAIVLQRTSYGEADRILQLLTPVGRFGAIARGVRKEKSKLAGGIELFAVSDVVLGQGKGELQIVTSARLRQFYRHIMEDYDRLQWGYWVIECVRRESGDIDTSDWYDVLVEVFDALNRQEVPLLLIQAWFFVRAASLLGAELNSFRDIAGERLSAERRYRYDAHERGFIHVESGMITPEHIKLMRLLASQSLAVLRQISGIEPFIAECADIARRHAALD